MLLKNIVAEDFCNYKYPSMFLVTAKCDWKCCLEQGIDIAVCQNSPIASHPNNNYLNEDILKAFQYNDITKAVVIGGLEPILQFDELEALIKLFRDNGENCDIVIYTGYYPCEIRSKIDILSRYNNIIMKFGRFIPGREKKYDSVLGVTLASSNQFAKRIS